MTASWGGGGGGEDTSRGGSRGRRSWHRGYGREMEEFALEDGDVEGAVRGGAAERRAVRRTEPGCRCRR